MRYIVSQETIADKAIEIMADINEHIAKGLSVVEVRKYNKTKETSLAQMAYIHCENGPIKMLAKEGGYSELEAEIILKRYCGEHLFVVPTENPTVKLLKSKTDLTTKETSEWIENMYHWLRDELDIQIQLPNKEWRL